MNYLRTFSIVLGYFIAAASVEAMHDDAASGSIDDLTLRAPAPISNSQCVTQEEKDALVVGQLAGCLIKRGLLKPSDFPKHGEVKENYRKTNRHPPMLTTTLSLQIDLGKQFLADARLTPLMMVTLDSLASDCYSMGKDGIPKNYGVAINYTELLLRGISVPEGERNAARKRGAELITQWDQALKGMGGFKELRAKYLDA